MRRYLIAGNLALVMALSPSIAAGSSAEAAYRLETEAFTLEWREMPTDEEIRGVKARVGETYAAVSAFLGSRPTRKIHIVLGGPAEQPGGRWEYPRVSMGRVLLFKFVPDFNNYFTALAHELVHAFRLGRGSYDWFFEEGFAEFVALRVDPSLAGFPWFDYPIAVVAGQWLATDAAIPLALLQQRHRAVNLKCRAQSYALRSSFFDWLGRTYGDERLVEVASSNVPMALSRYAEVFGASLATLEARWTAELLEEYRSTADVETKAAAYRRDSPIRYQHVCARGVDF